ncbi:MAG: pilin [Candidatus Magasanikiibacteriota bacterium]
MKYFVFILVILCLIFPQVSLAVEIGECVCDDKGEGALSETQETFSGMEKDKCEKDKTLEMQNKKASEAIICIWTKSDPQSTPVDSGKLQITPELSSVQLVNPIGGSINTPKGEVRFSMIFGKIIKTAMGIIGAITLLVFVYAGGLFLTSSGNAEQVKQGTNMMLWAAIGLFIIFSSYAILDLIFKTLTN